MATSCTAESCCGLPHNEYHELLISYEGPLHPASDYYTKKRNKKTLCIRLPSSGVDETLSPPTCQSNMCSLLYQNGWAGRHLWSASMMVAAIVHPFYSPQNRFCWAKERKIVLLQRCYFTNKGRRKHERQLEREVRSWQSKEERANRQEDEKKMEQEWAVMEYVRRGEMESARVSSDNVVSTRSEWQ